MNSAAALERRGLPTALLWVIPLVIVVVAAVALLGPAFGLFTHPGPVTAKVIWCSTIPTDGCRIILTNTAPKSVTLSGSGTLTVGIQTFPLTCTGPSMTIEPGGATTIACTGEYNAPWGMTVSGTIGFADGTNIRFTVATS